MYNMLENGKLNNKIKVILRKHNIAKASIFGSYARGEAKKNSDIDILIEVPKGINFSLLDLVGLQLELENVLKKKVDILTYKSIHPSLKPYIMKDEIRII